MLKWYEHEETAGDIVISSRIRLARNFNDYLFAGVYLCQSEDEVSV